jgi:hypothetical protein
MPSVGGCHGGRARSFGHSLSKKWVRDPIRERDRVIHSMSVARNQRNRVDIAPFDAALPYTAAATLSLAIGSLVAVPTSFRLGMPAVLMAAALSRAFGVCLSRERLREQADVWLAEACSPNPSVYAWRVEELIGSERRTVGRTLSAFAEEVTRPYRRGAPILNRSQLRPQTELLFEVAHALQDPKRDASPRAIARTRLLITDCGSPLNCSARNDELHQALTSILADISEPGAAGEREQESPHSAPQPTNRARRRRAVAVVGTVRSFTPSCRPAMNQSTTRKADR